MFTRVLFGVLLVLLLGCANKVPLSPVFALNTDINTLNQEQLFQRLRYVNGDCIRTSRSHGRLSDCTQLNDGKERIKIGTKLTEFKNNWTPAFVMALKAGAPAMFGMKKEEVLLALGEPQDTNSTHMPGLTKEQLVYRDPSFYVYIKNGIVEAVQF